MVDNVETKEKVCPSLDKLIIIYEVSNQAEGKSSKTARWYSEMLSAFTRYMQVKLNTCDLAAFNIDMVRGYILYLRQKPKFQEHPYTPAQAKPLSPKTIQCHVRALKAFSSWLYSEGYTFENRLKNLKLPKAPVAVMEPLTPEETKTIIASGGCAKGGLINNCQLSAPEVPNNLPQPWSFTIHQNISPKKLGSQQQSPCDA
jgi:site-specific recombinase XerD